MSALTASPLLPASPGPPTGPGGPGSPCGPTKPSGPESPLSPYKSNICQSFKLWKTIHSSYINFLSYSLSKNAVLSWGSIRSCWTLRSTQTRLLHTLLLWGNNQIKTFTYIWARITTRSISTRNTNRTWGTFISRCSCGSLFSWWTLKKTGNSLNTES